MVDSLLTYNPGAGFTKTSGMGLRPNPFDNREVRYHLGVDYAAKVGSPIPAASSGVVVYRGMNDGGYGNTVIIKSTGRDGSNYYILYAHQTGKNMPVVGAFVKQGDIIGEVGITGNQKGAHLHLEVLSGNTPVANSDIGGGVGFRPSVRHYRLDPEAFNNWADGGKPFGADVPVKVGTGGKGGPYDIADPDGDGLPTIRDNFETGEYSITDYNEDDYDFVTRTYNSDGDLTQIEYEIVQSDGAWSYSSRTLDSVTGRTRSFESASYDSATGETSETSKTFNPENNALLTHEESVTRRDGSYTVFVFNAGGRATERFDFVPDRPGSLAGVEYELRANGMLIKRRFDENEEQIGNDVILRAGNSAHTNTHEIATGLSETALEALDSMGLKREDYEIVEMENGEKVAIIRRDSKIMHADGTRCARRVSRRQRTHARNRCARAQNHPFTKVRVPIFGLRA